MPSVTMSASSASLPLMWAYKLPGSSPTASAMSRIPMTGKVCSLNNASAAARISGAATGPSFADLIVDLVLRRCLGGMFPPVPVRGG